MQIQNNVFGKSQHYNKTMSRQEKRQRAEIQLKEVLDKKIFTPPTNHSTPKECMALLRCEKCAVTKKVYSYNIIVPIVTITTKECTVRTGSVMNYYENYFSNMLQAQVVFAFKFALVFQKHIPIM